MQNGLFSLFMTDSATAKSVNFEFSQLKAVKQFGELDFNKLLSQFMGQAASGDAPEIVLNGGQTVKLPAIFRSSVEDSGTFADIVSGLAEMNQIPPPVTAETVSGDLPVVWINFNAPAGQSPKTAPSRGDIWIVPAPEPEAGTVAPDMSINAETGTALLWWTESIAMALPVVTPQQLEAADGPFPAVIVSAEETAGTKGALLWLPAPESGRTAAAPSFSGTEAVNDKTVKEAPPAGEPARPGISTGKPPAEVSGRVVRVRTESEKAPVPTASRETAANEPKPALTNNGKQTVTVPKQESAPVVTVKTETETGTAPKAVERNVEPKQPPKSDNAPTGNGTRKTAFVVRISPETISRPEGDISSARGTPGTVNIADVLDIAKGVGKVIEVELVTEAPRLEAEVKTAPRFAAADRKIPETAKLPVKPEINTEQQVKAAPETEQPVKTEAKAASVTQDKPLPEESPAREVRSTARSEQPVPVKASPEPEKTDTAAIRKTGTPPVKAEKQEAVPRSRADNLITALLEDNQKTERPGTRTIRLDSGRTVTIREHIPDQSRVKVTGGDEKQSSNPPVASKPESTGETVKPVEPERQTAPPAKNVEVARNASVTREAPEARNVVTPASNTLAKDSTPAADTVITKETPAKNTVFDWSRFEVNPKEVKTVTTEVPQTASTNEVKEAKIPDPVIRTAPVEPETISREKIPVRVSLFEPDIPAARSTESKPEVPVEPGREPKLPVTDNPGKTAEPLRMTARQQQVETETIRGVQTSGNMSELAPRQKPDSAVNSRNMVTTEKPAVFGTAPPAETAFSNSESFSDSGFGKSGGGTALPSAATTNTPAAAVQPAFEEALTEVRDRAAAPDLSEQVVKASRLARSSGKTQFSIRLIPESLGRLDVTVTLQNGKVHARFLASSDQAHNMLEKDVAILKTALSSAGINWDRISIESRPQTESFAGHLNQGDQGHSQNNSTGGQFNGFTDGNQNKSSGWNNGTDNHNSQFQSPATEKQNTLQPVYNQAGGLDITA